MIRVGCGSLVGAQAHAAAGEAQCGWCARGEALARLEAEAVPSRPAGDPVFAPVTMLEAAEHAAALMDATEPQDQVHPGSHSNRRRPLRVISGDAA